MRVTAGSTSTLIWSATDPFADPPAGSQPRLTAKMRISTMPMTNSGVTARLSPEIVITRSLALPWRRAARVPPMMPSGTTSSNVISASLIEANSAVGTKSITGARNL